MSTMKKILQSIFAPASAPRRLASDSRGVAAVEFAFIAPIMILLFVGTIELSAGISVDRKLSRLSSTLSDLASQSQQLSYSEIENIMDISANVIYPYDMDSVTIILTGISLDGDGNATVAWSCAKPSGNRLGKNTSYEVPTDIKKSNTFLVAAKVKTTYSPLFGWAQYSEKNGLSFDDTGIALEKEIFTRPRIGSSVSISSGTNCNA